MNYMYIYKYLYMHIYLHVCIYIYAFCFYTYTRLEGSLWTGSQWRIFFKKVDSREPFSVQGWS